MAATVRMLCSAGKAKRAVKGARHSCRCFSQSSVRQAGSKWRLEHGLARSGSEYGPLTDLPDWSFADGRPAPLMKGQLRRQKEREEFARRVVALSTEMEVGIQKWREKKEDEKIMEEKRKSQLLKPKGKLLLKHKK